MIFTTSMHTTFIWLFLYYEYYVGTHDILNVFSNVIVILKERYLISKSMCKSFLRKRHFTWKTQVFFVRKQPHLFSSYS